MTRCGEDQSQGSIVRAREGVIRVGCLEEASAKLRPEGKKVRGGRRGSSWALGTRLRSECISALLR